MSEVTIGVIGLLLLVLVFLTGLELGFAMAIVGFLGFSYIVSIKSGLTMVSHDVYDTISNYGFTVIPVFILMGQIAFNGGIAKRLYNSAYKFIGHIPGGLAMATVGGATAFGSVTGSITATSATFGSIAIPEMDRFSYSRTLSTGVVAASGTLGCLIPPSVPLIVYGIITEQSIGKLFLTSIFPGLLVSLFFLFIIYVWCSLNPSLGQKGKRFSWRKRIASIREVTGVGIIFIVVMGGMMKGFFTPTEAGSIGAFSVGVLAFISGDININSLFKSLKESLVTACMVLILIAGSTIFGHFITVTKIPMIAADWIVELPLHRHLIMILIGFVYLFYWEDPLLMTWPS